MFFTPLNLLGTEDMFDINIRQALGTHAAATYLLYDFVNEEVAYPLIWVIFGAMRY
jgi:hypothetical protein